MLKRDPKRGISGRFAKAGKPRSREGNYSCPVFSNCRLKKGSRYDNVLSHMRTVAKFDEAGQPFSQDSVEFKKLGASAKDHTLYFLQNNLNRHSKIVLKPEPSQSGTVASYFMGRVYI